MGTQRQPVVYLPHGGGPWPFVDVGIGSPAELAALSTYLRSLRDLPVQPPQAVLMVSAQSAKTQLMLNLFNWTVNEDPGPSMWVMANADMMSEFLKKRLVPSVDNCELTAAKLPEARRNVEKGVILFDTMFLAMRGSNSMRSALR
jgi:hypothetical protein